MLYNSAKRLLTQINIKQSHIPFGNQQPDIASNHLRCLFHSFQDNKHSWSVLQNLCRKQLKGANRKYACLLLNITDDSFQHFERHKYIWNDANLKIIVDGSANCLARRKIVHQADVVCGDFDSINPKLLDQLRCPTKTAELPVPKNHHNKASSLPQVIETPDQRETDFTKAIRVAIAKKPDIQYIFGLYYSDGSRIDHLFGLVQTLHIIKKNIILVNIQSNTVSWLLSAGIHTIQKPQGRELCSLVPFTGPTEVKTQGLEYNILPNSPLSFGGLISTSNICQQERESIDIETNRELLWSIDVCS